MNRLLLFVLSIFWCMAGISANHPSSLLPLPQKYQFNGKKSSGELTVEEKYVSQIEGAKFQEEAYHLLITKKGILLEATTPKGMYWGRQTLEQLKTTKIKRYICHSVKSPTGLPSVSVASCMMWAEALSQ